MAAKKRSPATLTSEPRLASLDAFRGFVILTMIFVNYCAGIGEIPDWLKHAPADLDGYTFVDLVVPGFLFIVGVAIPLSLHPRIVRGDTAIQLLTRIVPRTLSLVFIGVVMVSMGKYSAAATGISKPLWTLLFYSSVIALWSLTPVDASQIRKRIGLGLRIIAIGVISWLIFIFRQQSGETVTWLTHSWWGILGMIGWAYAGSCLIFFAVRGSPMALLGALGMTVAIYTGYMHGSLPGFFGYTRDWLPFDRLFGTSTTIALAGVLTGNLFVRKEYTPAARLKFMLLLGLGLYAAGQLIRPLHHISKINGTDAFALVTAGECCLLFMVFYFLMDMRGIRRWAAILTPAGMNPLFAYILPSTFGAILSLTNGWGLFWKSWAGWTGVLNAAVMTGLMLGITALATRLKVVLKL